MGRHHFDYLMQGSLNGRQRSVVLSNDPHGRTGRKLQGDDDDFPFHEDECNPPMRWAMAILLKCVH